MKKWLKEAGNLLLILAGNALYAFALKLFILPANLMTGGTTGIALVIQHFTGFSISVFLMC